MSTCRGRAAGEWEGAYGERTNARDSGEEGRVVPARGPRVTNYDAKSRWCQVRGVCRDDPLPPSLWRSTHPGVAVMSTAPADQQLFRTRTDTPAAQGSHWALPIPDQARDLAWKALGRHGHVVSVRFETRYRDLNLSLAGCWLLWTRTAVSGGSECDGTGTDRHSRRTEESMLFLDHGTTSPSGGLGRVALTVTPATAWSSTGILAVGRRAVLAVRHDPVPVRCRPF